MSIEYRKGINHANADMLSRLTCETCVQCQMQHEDPKTGKIRTRILNTITEGSIERWQQGSKEIEQIHKNIVEGKEEQMRLVHGKIYTRSGKLWIPQDKCKEMIRETHRLLAHTGSEKVAKYLRNFCAMENLWAKVQDVVRSCEVCQKVKVISESETIRTV